MNGGAFACEIPKSALTIESALENMQFAYTICLYFTLPALKATTSHPLNFLHSLQNQIVCHVVASISGLCLALNATVFFDTVATQNLPITHRERERERLYRGNRLNFHICCKKVFHSGMICTFGMLFIVEIRGPFQC